MATRRRRALAGAAAGVLVLAGWSLWRLRPSAPAADRSSMVIGTVELGEMVLEVRGTGTLVPEEVRWIPAAAEARVERVLLPPGTEVEPASLILELANPELELQALEAESEARAAEARLVELKARLEGERLDRQAAALRAEAEARQARLRSDADAELAKNGLVAALSLKLSRSTAEELEARARIEGQRRLVFDQAIDAQLLAQGAEVGQRRAGARVRRALVEGLHVRAGIAGVLQQVTAEAGQRVTPGANLARVARPDRLRAVVRVPETRARDLAPGQPARVDTRIGIVAGTVVRVDPGVRDGTVTVDLALRGRLPRGARPDLSVDAVIEVDRIENALHVARPALAQPQASVALFRLVAGTDEAVRTRVRLGRASEGSIEVVEGLAAGDRIILSDTSAWDAAERIRLR